MRIVFFGSDDFAAVCLRELQQSSQRIVACVTGPDVQKGRGMKFALSPIKEFALEIDVPCLQPVTLKDTAVVEQLKGFNADVFVVVAYGRLLPQAVLDIPKKFCVNVHGSLLPQYRGAAPVNWAVINGDKLTGVTVQKMVLELDAGDIISQQVMPLNDQITSDVLRAEMAQVGAGLLVKTLHDIEAGAFNCTPQNKEEVTYAAKMTKELGLIDWKKPATQIERLVRGLRPWPGTYTLYKGKVLKILEVEPCMAQGQPGTIVDMAKDGFVVACGQDSLRVKKVHLEASKAVSAYDFIQGYKLKVGDQLV